VYPEAGGSKELRGVSAYQQTIRTAGRAPASLSRTHWQKNKVFCLTSALKAKTVLL